MKQVIVLDLDRTLICSYVEPIPTIAEDFTIVTELEKTKYFIYKRPYLDNFLKRLSEKYDLIFWTAACMCICTAFCFFVHLLFYFFLN